MSPVRFLAGHATLAAALGTIGLAMTAGAIRQDKGLVVRAVEGLRYDPPRLRVEPGRELRLRFENADTTAQPHNLVLLRPGTRAAVLAAAIALGADGPARGYVPASNDIVAASRLLAAGEGEDLVIVLPDTPGIYPMLCTFPGHGVIMYGAVYAGVDPPRRIEDDPQVPMPPRPPAIDPDPRPMVRRMFLPDASPAAIAVALPGDLNLCWDAGRCRLRYAWRGGFLDAEDHFTSKGQALARLGGPVVMTAPETFPLRFAGRDPMEVSFRGYALKNGCPEFQYIIDGQLVTEGFSVEAGVLVRRWSFPEARGPVDIRCLLAPWPEPAVTQGVVRDGVVSLSADQSREVVLRYATAPTATTPDVNR